MTKRTWGGKRPGAGREKVADKRTLRGLAFNAAEWETIKAHAETHGLSARAYLFSLVEKDK